MFRFGFKYDVLIIFNPYFLKDLYTFYFLYINDVNNRL